MAKRKKVSTVITIQMIRELPEEELIKLQDQREKEMREAGLLGEDEEEFDNPKISFDDLMKRAMNPHDKKEW